MGWPLVLGGRSRAAFAALGSRQLQTAASIDVVDHGPDHSRGQPAPRAAADRPRQQQDAADVAAASWTADLLRPNFRALLVDAAGTLLSPTEPAAAVYLRYGRKYGVALSEAEVLRRYRQAYSTPWAGSTIRYVGDGRPFWRFIVSRATGCDDPELFEEIYSYYARAEAWSVSPGACDSLARIRAAGIKTAVVSNFDTRLRTIMAELGIDHLFDAVAVSAEVGAEKPNPLLFHAACDALGVVPGEAIHVGDDRRNDLFGGRDAGCFVWLWGADVHNFLEVERRLETGNLYDSLSGV